MRAPTLTLLALCLCAGLAAASDVSCGPSGLSGGWQPISNGSDAVVSAALGSVLEQYGANITALLGDVTPCDKDGLNISTAGCEQVVAGTNYKIWANLTCVTGGSNYTLGLSLEAFEPLSSDNSSVLQLYDVDIEFVSVNGKNVVDNTDSPDDNDRWVHNATLGAISDNINWTDMSLGDDLDGVDDSIDGVNDVDDQDGLGDVDITDTVDDKDTPDGPDVDTPGK